MFEARIRALEGWRAEKAGEDAMLRQERLPRRGRSLSTVRCEERSVRRPEVFECGRISTISAGAGGVVGGVVAVLVRVLRRGGEGVTSAYRRAGRRSCAYQNPDPVYTTDVMHTGVYANHTR